MGVMTFDVESIYNQVLAAGETWADLKAAYEALNDNTKSVLAEITGRYLDAGQSKAAAEVSALASKDYREHLVSLSKCRGQFLRAQVSYDSLRMLAEFRRSQESTRRAEMNMR